MILELLRPTVETAFVIDWNWFPKHGVDPQGVIAAHLCPECRREFEQGAPVEEVDWVDSATGEVFRMDSMREHILAHCHWKPDFITSSTPLASGVFRALLANNNRPLTPLELARQLGRNDPETILRTLTVGGVKNGVVPARRSE